MGTVDTDATMKCEYEIQAGDLDGFQTSLVSGMTALQMLKKEDAPAYAMLMLTDRFLLEDLNVWGATLQDKDKMTEESRGELEDILEKVLEIRLFHEDGEVRWFRSTIDKPLKRRDCLEDANKSAMEYWDEEQYLDIDTIKTEHLRKNRERNAIVQATGGGKYQLPGVAYDKNPKVTIRNYLAYESDGRCYVKDWRIVTFSPVDSKENERR